jgi:hypothetical protein
MKITEEIQDSAGRFAKENGFDSAFFETEWNSLLVFSLGYNTDTIDTCSGYPFYALFSENTSVRLATHDEVCDILDSLD